MDEAGRLMERVRSRDADAFELLYDRYHRVVYGVALRVLADAAAAEDVTQSVFLKLWSSPQLFRDGNFGAWIARVARNRASTSRVADRFAPEAEFADSCRRAMRSKIGRSRISTANACAAR